MTKAEPVEKISILDFIKSLPFFEEFTDKEKSELINTEGVFEKYKDGETIIKQGNIESWLFVILLGKVRLTKSITESVDKKRISLKEPIDITVKELEIGSIFGEISLITKRPRNVTALAASPEVAVMKITKEIIDGLNESIQMKFQRKLLLKLAENLDEMNTEWVKLKSTTISKDHMHLFPLDQ